MEVLAVIPARYGSTRFPGKPLAMIGTKTLIQRVYSRVKAASKVNAICVATDHHAIYEHVQSFGGVSILTSSDHPNGTSRCLEAAEKYAQLYLQNQLPEIVINIQGDEPLIPPSLIDNIVDFFQRFECNIVSAVCPFHSIEQLNDPSTVKVVIDNNQKALYFSRSVIPYFRDRSFDLKVYKRHIGIYGYRYQTLQRIVNLPVSSLEQAEMLEQLRWMQFGYDIYLLDTDYKPIGVDLPEHVTEVESIIKIYFPHDW